MKKILLILISICILCTLFSAPVVATSVENNDKFSHITDETFYDSRYSEDAQFASLCNFLVERLSNPEKYTDELHYKNNELYVSLDKLGYSLSANASDVEDTKKVLSDVMNYIHGKCPELFWVGNKWNWSQIAVNRKKKVVLDIGITLGDEFDLKAKKDLKSVISKINELTKEFDGYVQEIADLIPQDYTDYEKILFVNDYFCVNFQYSIQSEIYSPYELLKKGRGVCQAYSLAFMAVMDKLGIRSDSIISKEMNHIWNLVEVNNKWYHIDVTWDDPYLETQETDILGNAQHNFFLLSEKCMHDKGHTGFDIDHYGYEWGNEYDNIEIELDQSLKSSFVKLNGKWYNTGFRKKSDSEYFCGLYEFDSTDISLLHEADLNEPIYRMDVWQAEDAQYFHTECFSCLVKYNDNILFNTKDAVCIFDGETVTTLYEPQKKPSEEIYGFVIRDDEILLQIAEDVNDEGFVNETIDKVSIDELIPAEITIENYDNVNDQVTICSTGKTKAALIFAAFDENGKLICIKISDQDEIKRGANTYEAQGFDTKNAKSIRVMVWREASQMPTGKMFAI